MGKSAAANWSARWARATVPNRANDQHRQPTQVSEPATKGSSFNNKRGPDAGGASVPRKPKPTMPSAPAKKAMGK